MNESLEGLRTFAQRGGGVRSRASHPGLLVLGAGKGGVGTSTLAVLLAHAAAREGMRTLLVDGTEGAGALHHLTGSGPEPAGLAQLARDEADLDQVVTSVAPAIDLVAAGSSEPEEELVTGPGRRAAALQRASGVFSRYDVVLVDAGARMATLAGAAALTPGGLAVVTTAEPVALAGCYAVLKLARQRFAHLAPRVVVTGRDPAAATATHDIIRSASERFLGVDVELAGALPTDVALAARVAAGDSPWYPGSAAGAAAVDLLGRLFPWMSAPVPDIRPGLVFPRS